MSQKISVIIPDEVYERVLKEQSKIQNETKKSVSVTKAVISLLDKGSKK